MNKTNKIHWYNSMRGKLIMVIVISMIIFVTLMQFVLTNSLTTLMESVTDSRLETDIKYLRDTIGDGDWNVKDNALYLGDILIGDGTEENANFDPFIYCFEKTDTDYYSFIKTSDEGLHWVGDKETGYQEGHYLRTAGSTKGVNGESIIGTYMAEPVAKALDEYGVYVGEANVNGRLIYCRYEALYDANGNIVGAIVVGRGIEQLNQQIESARAQTLIICGCLMVGVLVVLGALISSWIASINKIKQRLEKIGTGEFPKDPLKLYIKDELGSVAESINEMTESLKDKERIGAELELANTIQNNMLPCIFPPFPEQEEFDIYATMEPAKEVGGDFYDFFMLDEKHIAIVIADVSGKGVPAAMFMVIAKALIKNYAQMGMEPANVFTKVNQLLCEGNDMGLFVTAWMAILNTETGKLKYVNAGHNPPMIQHVDGQFEFLKSRPGLVLAGMENIRYKQNELIIKPGTKLFLYTDGVTEAMDIENKLYGEQRLQDYLNNNLDQHAKDMLVGLREDISSFVGDAEQFDDITMLLLEYKKSFRNDQKEEMIFDADPSVMDQVMEYLDKELTTMKGTKKEKHQIKIAVEELFINVASYAYPEKGGIVKLLIDCKDNEVEIKITDFGIPFDPLMKEDPDINLPAEERGVGGLGIFMVKKFMDYTDYSRKNNMNIFVMKKKMSDE